MSVMLAKLEESFRSLVSKTSSERKANCDSTTPTVKKRSLECFEDEPVAKKPRLLNDPNGKRRDSNFGLSSIWRAGRESFSRLKSWVLKSVSGSQERPTVDPMRRSPKTQYYYQPSPILGGSFGSPYPSVSRPNNPNFGDYRPGSLPGMAHNDSANMGRGAVPKIASQISWNKNSSQNNVPQRQFVKNSTGVPFIRSGFVHTPYRPVQDKIFNLDSTANRSHRQPRDGERASGASESLRLTDRKRYEELLKHYTSVPLGQSLTCGLANGRPSVFGSCSRPAETPLREGKPIVVDLCNTNGNITFTAERAKTSTPMTLNTWERKFSLRNSRSSTPITQQPKKQTPTTIHEVTQKIQSPVPRSTHEIGAKSPAVANFEKTMNESKCMTSWIEDVAESLSSDTLRKERAIHEAQLQLKHCAEQKDQWEKEMVHRIKTRLKLSSKEPGILPDDSGDDEEPEDEFPELGDEAEQMVSMALRPGNPGEKLSEGFRIQITRADMATLSGLNWLNDEIINFYMEMIKDRGESEDRPKIHAFNTFFYPKIAQSGQQSVRRWTKRVNIFEKDILLIPVHLGMHWCLCVVNFNEKAVKFYDSMKGRGDDILKTVKQYLIDEKKDKQSQVFDTSGWKLVTVKDIPPQMNGSDCGVFTCKYADYISLNKEITFTQENMPYFRRRMVYEIMTKKLLLS